MAEYPHRSAYPDESALASQRRLKRSTALATEHPLHGLPQQLIAMIRGELAAALEALAALKGIMMTDDSRRVAAVVLLVEEVVPEFVGAGRKPWRAVPWLDCASQLLQGISISNVDLNGAREHISAARDLLARD